MENVSKVFWLLLRLKAIYKYTKNVKPKNLEDANRMLGLVCLIASEAPYEVEEAPFVDEVRSEAA